MRKIIYLAAGLIFICFSFNWSFGENIAAEEILKRVDQRIGGDKAPRDVESTITMKIVSSSGNQRIRKLKAWSKNNQNKDDWRMMKFISPPDVEDMGFLVLSDDQMYLYLPEYRRVRRIASHNRTESFVGSDFSYEDMGSSEFSKNYNPELIEENEQEWVLELTKKEGSEKPYQRVKMWVSKKYVLPIKMEMYDESGNLWKIAEENYKKVDDYWISSKIIMKNKKEDSWSSLQMENIKVDQGLESEIFTLRYLKRRVK